MRLGERETAARRDAQIRGAEAFMADEQDDDHLARHFDGWVRHEYHMHPPTDRCKVCFTDEIRRLQAVIDSMTEHTRRSYQVVRDDDDGLAISFSVDADEHDALLRAFHWATPPYRVQLVEQRWRSTAPTWTVLDDNVPHWNTDTTSRPGEHA